MSVDYIDQSNGGWMTRDYTMDQSDLAQMNVTGYKTLRGGARVPIINGDNFLPDQSSPAGMANLMGGGYDNYAANGWQRNPQTGAYQPPTGNAGQQVPGVTGNAAGGQMGNGAGRVTPIPGSAPVPQAPQQAYSAQDQYQLQANQQELNRQATWGQTPVTGVTNPDALAAAQRTRAAWVQGGTTLLNQLTNNSGGPLNVGGAGDVSNPAITGSEKKQVGDSRLNMDLINDPRFKALQQQNPQNASRFYEAVTGRGLDTDLQAQVAQMTSQRAAQDKLATEVGPNLMVAQQDNKTTGIKAGDFVKRVVQPDPLNPGQSTVSQVPLSQAERQVVGIGIDGSIQGNSMFHRATGLYGDVDIKAMNDERSRLMAKSTANDQQTSSYINGIVTDAMRPKMIPGQPAPVSNKFVPFDSPTYDTSAQSSFGRDSSALGSTIGNNVVSGMRWMSNVGTGIGNYFTGSNNPMVKSNQDYIDAATAQAQKDVDNGTSMADWYHG